MMPVGTIVKLASPAPFVVRALRIGIEKMNVQMLALQHLCNKIPLM